jgi:excisionase family DNA binding protein
VVQSGKVRSVCGMCWYHRYVAGYLGVTVRHARLVQERRIPYLKWGRLLRFDLAEIANWIDKWRHGC